LLEEDMTPYTLVEVNRGFSVICSLYLQGGEASQEIKQAAKLSEAQKKTVTRIQL
jgi:hypothetical protein